MATLIEPGYYSYDLAVELPIELDPPKDWTPGNPKYGKTATRTFGGVVKVAPPATEEGVRDFLVNQSCPDLKGHTVTVTHFTLKPGHP